MATNTETMSPSDDAATSVNGWMCGACSPSRYVGPNDWNTHFASQHGTAPRADVLSRRTRASSAQRSVGAHAVGFYTGGTPINNPESETEAIGIPADDLINYQTRQFSSDGKFDYTNLSVILRKASEMIIPGHTIDQRALVAELALYLVRTDATDKHVRTGTVVFIDNAGNDLESRTWEKVFEVFTTIGTEMGSPVTARRLALSIPKTILDLIHRGDGAWAELRKNGTKVSQGVHITGNPPYWYFLSFAEGMVTETQKASPEFKAAKEYRNAYAQLNANSEFEVTRLGVADSPRSEDAATRLIDQNTARAAQMGLHSAAPPTLPPTFRSYGLGSPESPTTSRRRV